LGRIIFEREDMTKSKEKTVSHIKLQKDEKGVIILKKRVGIANWGREELRWR